MATNTKQIKACLFDMDGLLLNTEDIYTEVTNEVLAEHGKGPLPWDVKIGLQGLPGPAASAKFLEWSKLPYTPDELFKITSQKQETKWPTSKFLPGALELLKHLKESKVPFALATSSHRLNFERKTRHLQHGFELFGEEHIVVGDDKRIPPGRGKPNPDIWFVALETLNEKQRAQGLPDIKPHECLVFEDGVPGVQAGKAAGANIIWVPHPNALEVLDGKQHEIIGDSGEILRSLEELDKAKYGL